MSLDPGSFSHMASDTANAGSSRDVNFRCLMGERGGQWVGHLLRRCFESEPSAVYAARLCDNAGFRFCRTHVLSTAVVGTSRDFSLHVATGSNRPCCAVHPDDSACPLIFWVHRLRIANFCDTSTHLHVRVTSLVRCCLAAPSGDSVCPRIFLTLVWQASLMTKSRSFHLAACVGRHVGRWTVLCAPREPFVHGPDTLPRDSKLEFHSQCAAELRQAQGPGGGERTIRKERFVVRPSP